MSSGTTLIRSSALLALAGFAAMMWATLTLGIGLALVSLLLYGLGMLAGGSGPAAARQRGARFYRVVARASTTTAAASSGSRDAPRRRRGSRGSHRSRC